MISLDHYVKTILEVLRALVATHVHWNGDLSQEDTLHKLRELIDALDEAGKDAEPQAATGE